MCKTQLAPLCHRLRNPHRPCCNVDDDDDEEEEDHDDDDEAHDDDGKIFF